MCIRDSYWGARDYLIDPAKAALSPPQAIAIGLGFILGGLAVYEACLLYTSRCV